MAEIRLLIDGSGSVSGIYSDTLLTAFLGEGKIAIKRASHVEPCGTKWIADMAPSGGPILGPFATRGGALEEEARWLQLNRNL